MGGLLSFLKLYIQEIGIAGPCNSSIFCGFIFLFENKPHWIAEQLHQFLFSFPMYKISVSMHPCMCFLDDGHSDWSDIESQRAYNPIDHLLNVSHSSEISR